MKKSAFAAVGLLALVAVLFGCRLDIGQSDIGPKNTGIEDEDDEDVFSVPAMYDLGFAIMNETEGPLLVTARVGTIPGRNAHFDEFVTLQPAFVNATPSESIELGERYTKRTITAGKSRIIGFGGAMGIFQHLFDYEERVSSGKMLSFVVTISRNGETLYRAVGWDVPEEDVKAHRIDEKMLGFFDPEMQREEHDWPGYPEGIVIFHLTSTAFPGSQGKEETKRIPDTWTYYIRAAETDIALETMNVWSLGPAWPSEDSEFAVIELK